MFGDDIRAALPEMQDLAAELMTLELQAYAPGEGNDVNGIEVPLPVLQGTTCGKINGPSSASQDAATRTTLVGGVSRSVYEAGLHIPVCQFVVDDVLQIKAGDRGIGWEFLVTKVGPRDDHGLMGRRFLIVGVPAKSYATARRLDIAEV